MNGLLVINKPSGMTSHDVVNVVRRLANMRRVGHTGTLDPLATGIMLVLVGPATRLAQFLSGCDKSYRAVIRLGESTSTYDAEGQVTAQREVHVSREDLEAVLPKFSGPLQQIPPMYSAIKVKGQKLYQLARQGKEIEREPRAVTIHQLHLQDWSTPDLTVNLRCSAGTYVRSLAHDLGELLGCGAHLSALQRTSVGSFDLAQSHTLDALRELAEANTLHTALAPPKAALSTMPVVQLDEEQTQAVRYGQVLDLTLPDETKFVQAHDAHARLVAVLIPVETGKWRPKLVLPEEA